MLRTSIWHAARHFQETRVRPAMRTVLLVLLACVVLAGEASAYDCSQASYDRAYAQMDLAFKSRTLRPTSNMETAY